MFAQTFKKDILILGLGGVGSLVAVANLDTACDVGNWISHRLVRALGRMTGTSPSLTTPRLSDANGNRVERLRIHLSLTWRVCHHGIRGLTDEFFVLLPQSEAYDIIVGGRYLLDKSWVFVNEGAMLPMTEHMQEMAGSCSMKAFLRD